MKFLTLDDINVHKIALGAPRHADDVALLGRLDWRRVIDGDTVTGEVFFDLPVVNYQLRETLARVRVYGVDSPETRGDTKEAGDLARAFTLSWMQEHGPHCVPMGVYMVTLRAVDHFGRFVADVACGQGHDLGGDLIVNGYAERYEIRL